MWSFSVIIDMLHNEEKSSLANDFSEAPWSLLRFLSRLDILYSWHTLSISSPLLNPSFPPRTSLFLQFFQVEPVHFFKPHKPGSQVRLLPHSPKLFRIIMEHFFWNLHRSAPSPLFLYLCHSQLPGPRLIQTRGIPALQLVPSFLSKVQRSHKKFIQCLA